MNAHHRERMSKGAVRPVESAFSHVDTWVFDLDNTLYPPDSPLWPQIDDRITNYIMNLYGLDGLGSRALQKHFYHRHGTTLKALVDLGDADPDHFMDFVHDIDRSSLVHNLQLSEALGRLRGRKLILTNGSRKHAEIPRRPLAFLTISRMSSTSRPPDISPSPSRSLSRYSSTSTVSIPPAPPCSRISSRT